MNRRLTRYEIGSRFEDLDPRQGDRVVRITDVRRLGPFTRYQYTVEVATLNPTTKGKRRWVSETTLSKRYRKVSR